MSLLQKTYVDYRNLGDKGQDNTSSIQPVVDGEPASMLTFARPSENLRSRTEIARGVFEDLLYYRDRTYRYVLETGGGTPLTWEVGGVGRVNNPGFLIVRPLLTTRTNIKGMLTTGTAAVNELIYQVDPTAYATDGMNEITVEHRNVPGTVTPVVSITAGPIYRVLVVFDSANGTHTAGVISGLLNTAFSGVPALSGKILALANGNVTAILAIAEISLDTRSHPAGTSGFSTSDVEAHLISNGALGTFTTSNPLQEGDVLAIRYDYVIEQGTDPDDPKGGVPGGRAESNQSRGNANVDNNLFLVQNHPEWLPGAIPLCRVVNGNLHWIDGTVLASGTSGVPGTGLGSFVNSAVFSGLPTVIVNGGIDNSPTIDTLQEALVSVDQRLSQHRFATYVITDGTNSTGGAFNAATAFSSAIAALTPNGGTLVVRRGNYTTGFSAFSFAGSIVIEGETADRGNTFPSSPLLVTQTTTVTFSTNITIRNMAFTRTGSSRVTLARDVTFENVTWSSGTFTLGNTVNRFVDLRNCQMLATNIATDTPAGLILNGERVTATNCWFEGPDLAANNTAIVFQGSNVLQAVYTNCSFINTSLNVAAFAFADTGNTYGTTFVDCYFRGIATGAFMIDLQTTYTGGDITFYNCRFDNTGGVPVIRTRHAGGRVRFINCTFLCAGSPNGTGTAFQNMLAIAPAPTTNALALATTSFENCHAFVNCTNFTNMTRAIVEFGSSDSGGSITAVFGQVRVKGFTLSFSGGTTILPPTTCMILCARTATVSAGNPSTGPHTYEDITILANGKSTPTTQSNINSLPPYIALLYNAASTGPAPTARNLKLLGVNGPQTTGILGGQLYCIGYNLEGIHTQIDVSLANQNQYFGPQIRGEGCTISQGEISLANFQVSGAIQMAEATNYRAVMRDITLYTPLVTAAGGSLIAIGGAELHRVHYIRGTALPSSVASMVVWSTSAFANAMIDCDIFQDSALVPMFTAQSATAARRGRLEGCRLVTALANPNVFINLGEAAPAGMVISGNTFGTNGATAAACIPDLSAVSDTLAFVKSNNTFTTTLPTPS